MKQASFPTVAGKISLFEMVHTDRDGKTSPAFILTSGDNTKQEDIQIPDWLSDTYRSTAIISDYVEDFQDLLETMEADWEGKEELIELMRDLLETTDNNPVVYEIAMEDFHAVMVLPDRMFSGRFQEYWDRVDEYETFCDLSEIAFQD